MSNIPVVKPGLVAVSRNCFPMSLSQKRRDCVAAAFGDGLYVANTIIENESDALKALDELREHAVNALCVYLGNFGPEGPETILAQRFPGPVMFIAAAEESGEDLIDGRGDAYCGMLNASYNLGLRKIRAYIPEYPVGTPEQVAEELRGFLPIARVFLGIQNLKVFSFGPRPYDFLACNAPIQPLYDIGIEIQENSELDLFAAYNAHKDDSRIDKVVSDMVEELGAANRMPGILKRLAQYEVTLTDWLNDNLGASSYAVFANKCWPAFQTQFGIVPCYVNSRFASNLIPIACETDIYGAISEYILACATEIPPTLLDINNTVPTDMYEENIAGKTAYTSKDVFMGFHCGNTPLCHLKKAEMKYQRIMKRSLEPNGEPDITRGTLEGDICAGDITLFRLQATADCRLKSYIAQGEVLDVPTRSFGGIGVFAISEMGRFYRHVLIEGRFPHHGAVGFMHSGKAVYAALQMLGVSDIAYNRPKSIPYPTENPWG